MAFFAKNNVFLLSAKAPLCIVPKNRIVPKSLCWTSIGQIVRHRGAFIQHFMQYLHMIRKISLDK